MKAHRRNAGFLLALAPMALFVLGVGIDKPWACFVFFFAILPLARLLLPDDVARPPEIDEISRIQLRLLNAIPIVHAAFWIVFLPWSMFVVRELPTEQLVGFGLSFWVVMSLNLTVAHELLHSKLRWNRLAARFVAGSIGYFQMVEEHRHHHAIVGGADSGDSAEMGQSVYAYAMKRYASSFSIAWRWERDHQVRTRRQWWTNRIVWTALITVAVAACFWAAAGRLGVALYLVLIIGTAFTMQAITYIQHWGLTDRLSPDLALVGYSWEDRCVMQAWVTLNHAYHGHHHRRPSLPYFRLGGFAESPRLPASYPVLLVVALIPPLFDRAMRRRLETWRGAKERRAPAGRQPCGNLGAFLDR